MHDRACAQRAAGLRLTLAWTALEAAGNVRYQCWMVKGRVWKHKPGFGGVIAFKSDGGLDGWNVASELRSISVTLTSTLICARAHSRPFLFTSPHTLCASLLGHGYASGALVETVLRVKYSHVAPLHSEFDRICLLPVHPVALSGMYPARACSFSCPNGNVADAELFAPSRPRF